MRAERLTRLAALERGHDEVLALGEAERISAIGNGDVPRTKSINETCTVFDALSH